MAPRVEPVAAVDNAGLVGMWMARAVVDRVARRQMI
jgi:hypothetical protein